MNKLKSFFKYDRVFLLVILLIGLLTTFSYGVYFDQVSEQTILFSNIKEYVLRFGGTDSKLVQDMTAADITEISLDKERDHGIAPFYPAGIVWYINQASPYAGSIFWHMYTFLMVFVGICSLYYLCEGLFGSHKLASFVTLLFFLSPRMFAESHYNNKDMVLLSLVLTCFYCGYRLICKPSWKNVCIYAVAGAFLFNVKIIGAYFFGLIGLYALLYFICTKQFNRDILVRMITCILLWLGVFMLITPATWVGPIEYVQYVFGNAVDFSRWSSYILFNGTMIHKEITGIPESYLPRLILFSTPLGILALTAAGGILLVINVLKKRFRDIWQREGYVTLLIFAGLVPIVFAIISDTSLYNGWRHFYFTYASLIMAAGYGAYGLNQLLRSKLTSPLRFSGAGIYVAVLTLGILLNHPFEYCYYNPLAGKNIEFKYDMDYWDLSVWQAYETILEDAENKDEILVSAFNAPITYGMGISREALPADDRERIVVIEEWEKAEYLVVNMTYTVMYNFEDYQLVKAEYELIETFDSYGNIVCEVYKKVK